ncbi:MAG: helix-turn-helix domain-containing protein [Acidimicrobiales bacterium]
MDTGVPQGRRREKERANLQGTGSCTALEEEPPEEPGRQLAPVATWPAAGHALARRRRALGLGIDEASRGTRISSQVLADLEAGQDLPDSRKVPALGYLRRYANYLGLDGDALALSLLEQWSRQPAAAGPSRASAARQRWAPASAARSHAARPPWLAPIPWLAPSLPPQPCRWSLPPGATVTRATAGAPCPPARRRWTGGRVMGSKSLSG